MTKKVNDDQLPSIKIPKEIRRKLEEKAFSAKRTLTDFVRIRLEQVANEKSERN